MTNSEIAVTCSPVCSVYSIIWTCPRFSPAGRRIGSAQELREETSAWATDVTEAQRGVNWQMKTDDARCKLKSVYPKIKR